MNEIDLKSIFLICLTVFTSSISAQTLDDAVRYSLIEYNSTSRFNGVSGAFSGLGADVSTASTNPAGIAEFRKSEVTFTLNRQNVKNEGLYQGSIVDQEVNKIGLGNLGIVLHYDPPAFNIKTLNLAIGVNQLFNYNETIEYGGRGPGTIIERFLEQAETQTPDELDNFEAGPAFDAGAIYNFDNGTSYFSDFQDLGANVDRSEIITRSGSLNEVFLAVGSNINNKFSWGASLNFPFAKFEESRNYLEEDGDNSIDVFDNIGFNQNLVTSGVGFNLKLGILYKFTPQVRFGAAFHTKSYYFLTDEFDTSVGYTFTEDNNTQTLTGESPFSEFEYQFESPWRFIAGLGYLYNLGDLKGFVSGEVEYINYTSSAFNLTAESTDPLDQFFEEELNNEIDLFLTSSVNIRVGTEVAYKKARIRIGAALPGSPFNDDSMLQLNPSYSAGLGYRGNSFYIDAAYFLNTGESNYSPYRLINASDDPIIGVERSKSSLSLTFGLKI